MIKPAAIAIDFETALLDGTPSLDYYRPDFRVISCAATWRAENGELKRRFVTGENDTQKMLAKIQSDDVPTVVHNAAFEVGVIKHRFPGLKAAANFDTQRLTQVADNGGSRAQSGNDRQLTIEEELALLTGEAAEPSTGLSLQACVSRWLPAEYHNHKEPYYAAIRTQGVKAGKEGANLHLLTPEQLAAYNTADTDVTLLLYERLNEYFAEVNFNPTLDHTLYMFLVGLLVDARSHGTKINREALASYFDQVSGEMQGIKDAFRKKFEPQISSIEMAKVEAWVNAPLTPRGRQGRREKLVTEGLGKLAFNPGSTKQLKTLFVDTLGITPTFQTKESKQSKEKRKKNPTLPPFQPNPSFRAAHLPSYGEGGEVLANLKKRQIVGKQSENLLLLSEWDGRWHHDIRVCGTATGRLAGGSGGANAVARLNIQGLSRRDKGFMSCLIADPDESFVSIDLTAGEPTVTTYFSRDTNYYNACFGMVGKKPYYDQNKLLQIDDIYFMGASVSPTGKKQMLEAWHTTWKGLSFVEQWMTDAEVIKKDLKIIRAPHKTQMLALQYGQGPRGMVSHAYDNGINLHPKDAKEFHHAYWYILFPGVRRLGEYLQVRLAQDKALVTTFGYRLRPDQPRKALNYFIQSHVSGLIAALCYKLFTMASFAKLVTIIHDELVVRVPTAMVGALQESVNAAVSSLNADLKWSVDIRTGFVTGSNWYEAK